MHQNKEFLQYWEESAPPLTILTTVGQFDVPPSILLNHFQEQQIPVILGINRSNYSLGLQSIHSNAKIFGVEEGEKYENFEPKKLIQILQSAFQTKRGANIFMLDDGNFTESLQQVWVNLAIQVAKTQGVKRAIIWDHSEKNNVGIKDSLNPGIQLIFRAGIKENIKPEKGTLIVFPGWNDPRKQDKEQSIQMTSDDCSDDVEMGEEIIKKKIYQNISKRSRYITQIENEIQEFKLEGYNLIQNCVINYSRPSPHSLIILPTKDKKQVFATYFGEDLIPEYLSPEKNIGKKDSQESAQFWSMLLKNNLKGKSIKSIHVSPVLEKQFKKEAKNLQSNLDVRTLNYEVSLETQRLAHTNREAHQEINKKTTLTLTKIQKETIQTLQWAFETLHERKEGDFPQRKEILLVGPSGVGKTHTIRHFAKINQHQHINITATSWMPRGVKNAKPTLDSLNDFVEENQNGTILIDEIDKMASTTDWNTHIQEEIKAFLDGRLLGAEWTQKTIDKLRSKFLVVGAGTWQELWNNKSKIRGLNPKEDTQEEKSEQAQNKVRLSKESQVPEEILLRFNNKIFFLQPTTKEEFQDALQIIHHQYKKSVSQEELENLTKKAVDSRENYRWIESYVSNLSFERWRKSKEDPVETATIVKKEQIKREELELQTFE